MHAMIPVKTIGRYEVLEELGHGAMGSVFKAHDPAMGRTVALKTILAAALAGDKGEEYRARFYREAHAAGKLAHPGIVPVFDVGEQDGTPFLVMEYVEGRTLSAAAWGGERFTVERSCEVGQQIAEALGYAHRKGVIHRDIKPANILMTSPEAYGSERARITDFGVAKLAAGDMTSTGQLLGTPAFMPPEQYTGSQVDGRADLFSLGVILYGLVTGERPFTGDTMTAVSYKVVHTEPVPPRRLNPAIPQRLDEVILKCLAKSPADRFQTGEELAQELAALRGVPITASALRSAVAVRTVSGTDATIDSAAGETAASTRPWNQPMGVEAPATTSQAAPAVARRGLRGRGFRGHRRGGGGGAVCGWLACDAPSEPGGGTDAHCCPVGSRSCAGFCGRSGRRGIACACQNGRGSCACGQGRSADSAAARRRSCTRSGACSGTRSGTCSGARPQDARSQNQRQAEDRAESLSCRSGLHHRVEPQALSQRQFGRQELV